MTQEHGEQFQAETELSDQQLDRVAGGDKDPWPSLANGVGGETEPPLAR